MKKHLIAIVMAGALAASLGLAACSQGGEAPEENAATEATQEVADGNAVEATIDGGAYGYTGEDPAVAAAYQYLSEEVSKNFDEADISIPTVNIVAVDSTNPDEVLLKGDFWVENYNIEGDTLACVSGGNFPGVMHLSPEGSGYVVSSFDVVADGSDFQSSAQELFGDDYDAFMQVNGDSDAREELRKATVSDYVKLNSLDVTQYQDYGWDPVELDLQ